MPTLWTLIQEGGAAPPVPKRTRTACVMGMRHVRIVDLRMDTSGALALIEEPRDSQEALSL